jgi:hypothetical protein
MHTLTNPYQQILIIEYLRSLDPAAAFKRRLPRPSGRSRHQLRAPVAGEPEKRAPSRIRKISTLKIEP